MTDALSPASQSTAPPTVATAGDPTAGEVLTAHLTAQATAFLRALPTLRGEPGGRSDEQGEELLRAVRRVGGALHTFAGAMEPGWAQDLRDELRWLLDMLAQEPSHNRRLARLLTTLDSLTRAAAPDRLPAQRGGEPSATGMLAGHPGAAKARALLERQLSVARARIHTSSLQELRSARLHALADRMTLLTGEVPLAASSSAPAREVLLPQAAAALGALAHAAEELPLLRAGAAYNGDARHRLRTGAPLPDADAALGTDDAPWLRVRILVKRARYALEVCRPLLGGQASGTAARLESLSRVLDRHQEAADAASTAAAAARTPRITPATAYVLGVVHADQRLEVEAARYSFGCQWPELRGSDWPDWPVR
ncbi:CHAD domain-containing protein [Peterkaempfera griseoplana]|uniref:CHAD domain-containing protein n=1 Tax=Peterkaempfera griseoplana TaxID=66896 RepID=UPI0006E22C9F|nr:CHAD domain-containing protein [Peterkaempfera griseoplana]